MAIAEQWKPGDAKKDNGVVFLVAVAYRKVQILTGYGIEGALPDGKVGEIRDRLALPAFREGQYAQGIDRATRALAAEIAHEYGVVVGGTRPVPERRARPGGGTPVSAVLLLVGILIALHFLDQATGARGRRGGSLMRRRRGGSAWGAGAGAFGGAWGGGGFGGYSGGGGGGGGGFGGFGGGRFGGGGAGGSW
jgi:uncharacterized protein